MRTLGGRAAVGVAQPGAARGMEAALQLMSARKPATVFILITLALDVLGFGLLIPVGPKLVQSLLNNGQGGNEAEAAPVYALLSSTFYTMMFLCAPMLGVLSDRFGRRTVILVTLLGSGLDFMAQALSPNLTWLFVTRAINGMTGASFGVATAYIADVTPPEKRASAFGLIGAAFGLGFVIGPVLGGLLGEVDIRLPFYVAAGLTLLNWLYGLLVLPESLPPERRAPLRLSRANPVGAMVHLTGKPFILLMACSLFLFNLAQFGLHATWALYTAHRYHWPPWLVGMSLMTVGLCAAAVQGGLARRLIPALGERRALLLGLLMGVVAYAGYGLATSGWMIFVVIVIGSLGGISQPACNALITRAAGATEQGAVQGALASLNSVAGIIGPLIGGSVLAYLISGRAPIDLPGGSFLLCAAISALGWLVAWAAVRTGAPADAARVD